MLHCRHMDQFNRNRPVFAADPASGGQPQQIDDVTQLRDAYLDKLTDPANGYTLEKAFPMPADLRALYDPITLLKSCLDSFRPLDPAQAAKLQEVFDVEYTYNSNRIEGNTLTLMETHLVVNKGLTIDGKPLREHLEAVNHHAAIGFLRELVVNNQDVTPASLCRIHAMILQGVDNSIAGRYRTAAVYISGSQHVPPNARKVPELMDGLFAFYETNKASMHPVELAAQMHEKLATIHPFQDGNGRTSRLLMNLILMRAGYPVTIISAENVPRRAYYDSLEAANLSPTGDNSHFQRYIAENVRHWLLRYLDMVSVDVSVDGKNKGDYFFRTIAKSLAK